MTTTITYHHGKLYDCSSLTEGGTWTETEDGSTGSVSVTPTSAPDYFDINIAAATGNKVYIWKSPTFSIARASYPNVTFRYKTSDSSIRAKIGIVLDGDTANPTAALAETSNTNWTSGTYTLTTGTNITQVFLYANQATGNVYYDFVLLSKRFTFPHLSEDAGIDVDAPARTAVIGIPGRVGDETQQLGSESATVHIYGTMNTSTSWKGAYDIYGEAFMDIAHNAYQEPWQWLTTSDTGKTYRFKVVPVKPFVPNRAKQGTCGEYDLNFVEYRRCSGSNEYYYERFGLV